MNTQTSLQTVVASKSDEDGPIQDSGPETQEAPKPIYRKIAKLPKPLRDQINSMLDDGHTAPELIAKLQASTAEEICHSFLLGFEKVTGIKPADGPIGPDINAHLTLSHTLSDTLSASSVSASSPALRSAFDEGVASNSSPLSASGREDFKV